ncbi:MAG: PAS domain-containing protein [Candidatus Omnitrophica bacterium]|nr:PAS domain-containing protein [Candidatus Omnitrophota bacterium]
MNKTFHLNISTCDNLGIGLFKYALSPEEKFITANSTLVNMLGCPSKEEFKNIKLDNLFVNPKEKDNFFDILRKNKKINFFETVFKNKKREYIWVAITASCVVSKDEKQPIEYLEGIIEDISKHKNMEEKLALEKDFLQGLLDNIPDAIYFKDRENRIIKVNKFYAQGMKLNQEQIIGKSDFDFFPESQAKRMVEDDNYVLNSGNPIVGKIEHNILPDGSWSQVITTKIPMYDKSGRIIGTMGITRDMTAYAHLEKERLNMLINALTVLAKALEMRDPYTFTHNQNVAVIAEKIARAMGWDENRILGIRLAGQLHDLGKISIPLDILNKPGKLSNLEYGLIQEHVKKCYDLIKDMEFPFSLAETIYQHHERLDGSGYPRELRENGIILEARILAISDVLESMTSYRPYREALGIEKAMQELENGKGSKYDSQVVEVVFNIIKDNTGKVFWLN